MRKVANIKNQALREEQFNTLLDVVMMIKKNDDLNLFLDCFLTDSEKAFLGQRLNIMRMLAKNFSYTQIKEKLSVSTVTISNAYKCLEKGGNSLKSIVLEYKFKPKNIKPKHDDIKPLVSAHYPGTPRF
jgi:Trp operon repressor